MAKVMPATPARIPGISRPRRGYLSVPQMAGCRCNEVVRRGCISSGYERLVSSSVVVSGGGASLRTEWANDGTTASGGRAPEVWVNGRCAKADDILQDRLSLTESYVEVVSRSGRNSKDNSGTQNQERQSAANENRPPDNEQNMFDAEGEIDGEDGGQDEYPGRPPGGGPIRVGRRRQQGQCYCCGTQLRFQVMGRLDNMTQAFRDSAKALRAQIPANPNARDPVVGDRICVNCRGIVNGMVSDDPTKALMNVLLQRSSHSCFICNAYEVRTRLPFSARIDAFLLRDIFIPEDCRCCRIHLTDDGETIQGALVNGLTFIRRRIVFHGQEAGKWMEALRLHARRVIPSQFESIDNFTDQELRVLTSVTKDQFRQLQNSCNPVELYGTRRNIYMKDLLLFLCKMRHGLSDEFLRVMFSLSSQPAVSLSVAKVRISLIAGFVPRHLGLEAITRNDYIARHVTDFSNTLYNAEPENRKAILVVDGTYLKIPKSSNFRVMRQSFCTFKHHHLVKPIMIVAPNGYILDVHGPYFSDVRNNDANILRHQLNEDIGGLRRWLQDGDIFLVDRGYRDALELLRQLGIQIEMPGYILPNRRQGETLEVNKSRLVTKSRWIVEARNGHVKSMFRLFRDMIPMQHVGNIGDFFRIACAIINAFRPEVLMPGADSDYARHMLERSRKPNLLMERVIRERLDLRANVLWVPMDQHDLPGFARLPLEYLRDFTFGTYQIRLSPGYIQDRLMRDRDFGYEVVLMEPGLLRARVFSRHVNATKYQLWIQFVEEGLEELRGLDPPPRPFEEPIKEWYCRCKQGPRTLGCCAHVASVLWYLGYARHDASVRYPPDRLLHDIDDAGARDIPDIIDPLGGRMDDMRE